MIDTRTDGKPVRIDFGVRLADGRSLMQAPRLCATVKEYAWWVRDPRYSRIDDATTHATSVRNLIFIAHALTLRGMWSFAHVQPYDIEQLIEEVGYGADAVLHASERVEAYLREMAAANRVEPKRFGGLPRCVFPTSGTKTTMIESRKIVADCDLPDTANMLPRVVAILSQAAKSNGMRSRKVSRAVAPLSNLTAITVHRWLEPIEQLYTMRKRMEAESIGFKPFSTTAWRLAMVKGVGTERTPIPPPTLVLHLLERSACCILDHGSLAARPEADRPSVVRTATACWVVIAAFTARRDREIDDLREGCLRGDDASGWWLHTYIEKTLQLKDWIPIPGLVARAIQVMSVISADARSTTGNDNLFQWLYPDGRVTQLDIGAYLDDFATTVEVPLHRPRGEPAVMWHWHPHQFRRFFAVLYFYRFEGASIEVLSHQLRRFSLEMTRRYVTNDPEVAAIWTDVEWGYMGHVARSIVAGERSVSGAAGEHLKRAAQKLVDAARRKLQVTSPDRVGASLTLLMQRQGMVLTPKPWVTCSCPRTRDAAARAACRREGPPDETATGPDFAHAGPLVCSLCPHAVIEGARTSVVESEVGHLETAAASKPRAGTLFGELEEARLVELRHARDVRYRSAGPVRRAALNGEVEA